jgi:hypothetical protein
MATAKWIEEEIERNYNPASQRGRRATASDARARTARYDARNDRIVVELTNGCSFAFPPRLAQGLASASAELLSEVEATPRGGGLHWEKLDVDLSVPNLVMGVFGSKIWMRELGRRGGRVTSSAKARAARENGRKGGRPLRTKKVVSLH